MTSFSVVDEVPVDPATARIFEHGWQSWSPTTSYPVTGVSPRPATGWRRIGNYRPETPAPEHGFQGEGLLGLALGGSDLLWATEGGNEVPSIRAELRGGHVLVSADGAVVRHEGAPLPDLLARWADRYSAGHRPRPAPTAWCSWYHYFTEVTEADVVENLDAIGSLGLPVDVVQIDDGWQAAIGDWLELSGRFSSLPELVQRIRDGGRRAGIWLAPFLATAGSALVRDNPQWICGDAGRNWGADLGALDLAHPGARDYLRRVFESLLAVGFDYFKIDFLYAGAVPGPRHGGAHPVDAYRSGLELVREAIGADSYLLGCGAPILPSVGLVDAMRVSPDVATHYAPNDGDPSQPAQLSAATTTIGRDWQHGRFWVNDSDCLIARPEVERREEWAAVVERYGGLRSSSDRIAALDEWGLATTRRLLGSVPRPTPFPV